MCASGVNCSLILDVDGPVHVGAHGLAQQPCQAIRLYRQVVGTEGASFWQRGLQYGMASENMKPRIRAQASTRISATKNQT